MPPKKKGSKNRAPKNSFYFYMIDFQAKKEAEGYTFPNGLKDVAEMADPFWKGLDPATKRHYENLAERAKIAGNGGVKYTTHGQTYEEVDRERREIAEKKKNMSDAIVKIVKGHGREALAQKRLYFIHVNFYCQQDNGDFVPCELALLAYSVQEGYLPQNIYHTFINPGSIPNGYSFKAKSYSDETHKTPLPPRGLGTGDYRSIYEKIIQLVDECGDLEDDGRPPPFFTMNQTMSVVANILQALREYAPPCDNKDGYFRVYSIEELFFEAKNFGLKPEGEHIVVNGIEDKGFAYMSTAEDMLKNDLYDFAAGITCDYHEEQDVRQHCSRSYVVRWSYIFSDNLCTNLDITMVSLRHAPRGTNFHAKVITNQMSRLSVLSGAGRGKLVEGRVVPVSRTSVSVPASAYGGSSTSGSVCGSSDRRMKPNYCAPITIIDHGQMNDAASSASSFTPYQPEHPSDDDKQASESGWKTVSRSKHTAPCSSTTANGDAPLRLPKGTGKAGGGGFSRTPVMSLPDEDDDDDYFNPTGVGRGRGLKRN